MARTMWNILPVVAATYLMIVSFQGDAGAFVAGSGWLCVLIDDLIKLNKAVKHQAR